MCTAKIPKRAEHAQLMQRRVTNKSRRGFTLVDLMIAVTLMGIMASVAIPHYKVVRRDATRVSLITSLDMMRQQIELRYHTKGKYPTTIEASWFVSNRLPAHAQNKLGLPALEVVNLPGTFDPTQKSLIAGAAGAYWYNRANGALRARVEPQQSEPATLDHYNDINKTQTVAGVVPPPPEEEDDGFGS